MRNRWRGRWMGWTLVGALIAGLLFLAVMHRPSPSALGHAMEQAARQRMLLP